MLFLKANIDRPNLHVLVNTHVTRILFSNQYGKPVASGVEFVRNNHTYTVKAGREVILSAGSINTPQLLMLSGIGPRNHLAQFDIPLISDLSGVGANLQDHIVTVLDYVATNSSEVNWSANVHSSFSPENFYTFYTQANGPLSQLPVSDVYLNTGITGNRDWPDALMTQFIQDCKFKGLT